MKKLFVLLLAVFATAAVKAQYSGSGDGTQNSPYLIYNEIQLSQVGNFLNQSGVYFKLMKDLDLASFIEENYPTEGWTPIGVSATPFKGVFDGNSHTLSGIWISKTSVSNVGFFGYTDGATISNLTLEGTSVKGVNQVGALIGYANNTTVKSCAVTFSDKVQGTKNVGGLVGQAAASTFQNITVNTMTKGDSYVGGFAGSVSGKTVSSANVTGDVSGSNQVGGFAGSISGTNISSAKVNGNVSGNTDIAGIIGSVNGTQTIQNATHIGDVSGKTNVAGIAGQLIELSSTTFKSCFSKGKLTNTGDYTGGIVGKSNGGAIAGMSGCSHFGDITGKQFIGGLIGAQIPETNASSDYNVYISTSSSSNTKTVTKSVSNFVKSTISVNVNNCVAIGNISGTSYVGGLVGKDERSLSCSDWVSGGSTSIARSWTTSYSSNGSRTQTLYIWYDGKSRGSKSQTKSTRDRYDGSYIYDWSISFSPDIKVNTVDYTNSYYSGIINGTNNVGGIAGYKQGGKIQYCYTHASIYADSQVGGIIGSATGLSDSKQTLQSNVAINNTISATTADIGRIYGKSDANTTVGALGTAAGNRALTTTKVIKQGVVQEITDNLQHGSVMGPALLRLKATYVAMGWNFDSDWAIVETESYPYKTYQAAPPAIESELKSQGTVISGSSTDGGTVYLFYKNRDAVSAVCSGNAWSFTTEPLQSGALVQLYADVENKIPSYLVSATVGYLGKGTEADPYLIYTAEDLQGASNKGYYKIMNDIDLTGWIAENSPQKGWVSIGRNSGESTSIDGDGHKVTGLWINTTEAYTGLFSNFSAGIIKNLTVEVAEGKSVKGGSYTGILIGRNANGQIINCTVKGDVTGTDYVGGVAGCSLNNTVENVSFTGSVSSSSSSAKAGGFAGSSSNDQLSLISADATLTVKGDNARVGGVVGSADGSTMDGIRSTAVITVNGANSRVGGAAGSVAGSAAAMSKTSFTGEITVSGTNGYVGGLTGYSEAKITESCSKGTVACSGSDSYTGGLVGMAKNDIADCYSTASVSGTLRTAGLCAYSYNKIDRCYAQGAINGAQYGAGVVSQLDGANAAISHCVALNGSITLADQYSWGSRVTGGFSNGAPEPETTNYALSGMQVSLYGTPQNKTDDNVEGIAKPESELKSAAFYSGLGWDMTSVWGINSDAGYPYLLWEDGATTEPDPEYKLGDANGDTFVNVGDITAVAAHILGQTPAGFNEQAADANADGFINVGDITAIAAIILGNTNHAPSRYGISGQDSDAEAQFTLDVENSDNGMVLHVGSINSDKAFSAFQFDLCLPENVSLSDIRLQDRCRHLTFDMSMPDDRTVRVIAYSVKDTRALFTSGELVTVLLDGVSGEEFRLTKGVFANSRQTIMAEDVTASHKTPTALDAVTETENGEIYDILGRRLNEIGKGIRIVGNKVILAW